MQACRISPIAWKGPGAVARAALKAASTLGPDGSFATRQLTVDTMSFETIDLTEMAEILARSPNYRVLRKLVSGTNLQHAKDTILGRVSCSMSKPPA